MFSFLSFTFLSIATVAVDADKIHIYVYMYIVLFLCVGRKDMGMCVSTIYAHDHLSNPKTKKKG